MNFERKTFEGFCFYWYGVDSTGAIAEFISAYGPIPNAVFSDEIAYKKTQLFIENLAQTTESEFTYIGKKYAKSSYDNLGYARSISRKGLFSFCEPDPTSEPNPTYQELLTIPSKSVKIEDLPDNIQTYLRKIIFNELIFSNSEVIRINNYFECDFASTKEILKAESSLFEVISSLFTKKGDK